MGNAKRCLLFLCPAHQLAQVFLDYFCGKIANIWDTLDRQAVASPPQTVHECLLSGVPFTHFDVVSEDCP